MIMPTSLDTPQIIETPSLQESLASSTTSDLWSPFMIPEKSSKDDSSDKTFKIAQALRESVTHQSREPTESMFFPKNRSSNHTLSQNMANMNIVKGSNEPLAEPSTADVF